jgi:hypothetical protein
MYDVGWSSLLTAGTATITVVEKKPSYGSTAYYIVAEGRPAPLLSKLYKLFYKVDTLLDASSQLPQRASIYSEEGTRHRTRTTIFDHPAKKAHYEVQTATLLKKDVPLLPYTRDALSALYVLRSMPLKTGDRFDMPVCVDGTVYKVQMTVGNVEPIQTPMGIIQSIKVTPLILDGAGTAPGRGLGVWVSNDERRLPVRLEAQLLVGKFTLVLSKAGGSS